MRERNRFTILSRTSTGLGSSLLDPSAYASRTIPAMSLFSASLRRTVVDGFSGMVTFDVEYTDLDWFDNPDDRQHLILFYRARKLAEQRPARGGRTGNLERLS